MTFPGLPAAREAAFEAERNAVTTDRTLSKEDAQTKIEAITNRQAEAALKHSVAGHVGVALEGISKLAGFDWRVNIALIGGVAAKEVVVSTLGTAYALGEVDPEEAGSLSAQIAADPAFSPLSALALIAFTILYAPCFVTVVTMVWVIGADDKVSPQPVTLGDQIGNNYLVEAGLKGGERIITEGIIKVRPGMTRFRSASWSRYRPATSPRRFSRICSSPPTNSGSTSPSPRSRPPATNRGWTARARIGVSSPCWPGA